MRSGSPARTILLGGLVVALLDGIEISLYHAVQGVSPVRIFHFVASGLLGRAAYEGGMPTFLLGLLIHVFVAFSVVTVYWLASRKLDVLTRRPVICGLLYGLLVYVFMTYVVVPLSAAQRGPFNLANFLNGVIGHALLIGLPSALFARAAARRTTHV